MNVNTTRNINQVMRELVQAINAENQEQANKLFEESMQLMKDQVRDELRQERAEETDAAIMEARGFRRMTSAEQKFYNGLIECMKAKNPEQALANLKETMPETVINKVAEDLRTEHPLLKAITFIPTGANIKTIVNTNGRQTGAWGDLCDEIVKELAGGFEVVNTSLYKLSAFLPVCKQGFIFTTGWLDAYVRATLYEAAANSLEDGIVDGTGKNMPIGMTREVGPDVTVTAGVYPRKAKIEVQDLDIQTMGNLVAMVAKDEKGKTRKIRNLLIVCNESDYYKRILPAIMILQPDGSYRNALPYPVTVIPVSGGLEEGEAVFGLGYRYFAAIGQDKEGQIEYSDHVWFLKDQRVFIIKLFANGFPMDNNSFLLLDISKLQRMRYVVQTSENTPSSNANLADLKIGKLALSSTFDPSTTSYTASTTDASNVLRVVPAEAEAVVECKLGTTVVPNGSALTWAAGSNTVTVKVTAANGSTTKTYTVTVTKS